MPPVLLRYFLILPFMLMAFSAHAGYASFAAVPVSVAVVKKENAILWHSYSGYLEAVDTVTIKPKVSGTIEKIHFTDGSIVEKDQVLFTLDPAPFKAVLTQAQGALKAAQGTLRHAQHQLTRAKTLLKEKYISKQVYDERLSSVVVAEGGVEIAKGAVNAATINLDYTTIKAPIKGIISRAAITMGNTVDAGYGAPTLATLVSTSPIYVNFEMDEQAFLTTIQQSSPQRLKTTLVRFGLSHQPDTPYQATIHSVDNQVQRSTGTIRVRAINDNHDTTLIPGLFVHMKVGNPSPKPLVLIKDAAISTDQAKKFVLVVDGHNQAQYREVVLGGMVHGLRVITAGLVGGEKIIVDGLMRVRPTMIVEPSLVPMTPSQ
jgi:membrane fusion protein, multidrug efflux system